MVWEHTKYLEKLKEKEKYYLYLVQSHSCGLLELGIIGLIFLAILKKLGLTLIGIILTLVFAAIGFVIGTFKMPSIGSFKFTQQTSGENLDDIIFRAIKFKMKKKRIYLYTKEEKNK